MLVFFWIGRGQVLVLSFCSREGLASALRMVLEVGGSKERHEWMDTLLEGLQF